MKETVVYKVPDCYEHKFSPGLYYISLFGAQWWQCGSTSPYGGHSEGVLRITTTETYYVCVGGKGPISSEKNAVVPGGFNGGGKGKINREENCGGGGGGMTDIRSVMNDTLTSIIVAGGGGGDSHYNSETNSSGRGGGIVGMSNINCFGREGKGGSIESGGMGGIFGGGYSHNPPCSASNGTRGQGGDACSTAGSGTGIRRLHNRRRKTEGAPGRPGTP